MSFPYWITVAALAMLPLAASAQQQQWDPADANATVPASGYVSAFKNYRPGADEKASPDELWRAANADLQAKDGPGIPVKDSGPENASPEARTAAPQKTTGQRVQVAPKTDPHAGHHGEGK